jgi:hypothetical protein
LEDSEWENAYARFSNALDINPKSALAYLGLLCVELKIANEQELKLNAKHLTGKKNFDRAVLLAAGRYSTKSANFESVFLDTNECKSELTKLESDGTNERLKAEYERLLVEKKRLISTLSTSANLPKYLRDVAKGFRKIMDYSDSVELADECERIAHEKEQKRRNR